MQIIKTIQLLREILENNTNKTVGFVPTMGALHEGHISLVKKSVEENDICVVSIFVNPTQFNNADDLLKYPRTLEADALLLKKAGCNIVFAPEVQEMYPEQDKRTFDFGSLEQVMEGVHRPGHFNGVAQIVSKLFAAVQPDKAYFGEKDFQQLVIVREMTRQAGYKIQIIACPIVREKSGLAMSSRNMRLSEEQREKAALIFRTLSISKTMKDQKSVRDLCLWIMENINTEPALEVEYFDIVNGYNLQSVESWTDTDYPVGCIAVFCGDVRLIDNITY